VDPHAAAEAETALEHRVSADARAPSDLHVSLDDRERPDVDVGVDSGSGIDDGRFVNSAHLTVLASLFNQCGGAPPPPL
jgi:hypothetical protein